VALGLEAASEEAYTSVVNRHVQRQLESMAKGVFDRRVLPAAQRTACHVPLEFLRLLLLTGRAEGGGGGGGEGGGGWSPSPGGWGAAEADEDEAVLRLQVRGVCWVVLRVCWVVLRVCWVVLCVCWVVLCG